MRVSAATRAYLVLAVSCLLFPVCETEPTVTNPTPTLTLNPASLDMQVGETRSFSVAVSGASGPSITFTTSAASVATVVASGSNIQVTCVGPGSAVITVTVSVLGQSVTGSVPVTCRAPSTSLIDVAPTSLAFSHTVGSTGCPQRFGGFRVESTFQAVITVIITSTNAALTVNPTNFMFGPGRGDFRDVEVSFNCSTQTSFVATINVMASVGPAITETKSVQVIATITRPVR